VALLIAAFLVLRPVQQIDAVADSRRKSDISKIYDGITLYLIDKGGEIPTFDGGKALPTITSVDILTAGIEIEKIDSLVPDYIVSLSKDPTANSYRLGLLKNGRVAVAIKLSNGEVYLVSELSSSLALPRANETTESSSRTALPGGVPVTDE